MQVIQEEDRKRTKFHLFLKLVLVLSPARCFQIGPGPKGDNIGELEAKYRSGILLKIEDRGHPSCFSKVLIVLGK